MTRADIDYIVLDALANDLESVEDILRLANHPEIGWTELAGGPIAEFSVLLALPRLVEDGLVRAYVLDASVGQLQDLRDLGIQHVAELRGQDPERLYARLIAQRGVHQDRCVLYVFRCAVYFAETAQPDAERLKWWNWKDAQPVAPARRNRKARTGATR